MRKMLTMLVVAGALMAMLTGTVDGSVPVVGYSVPVQIDTRTRDIDRPVEEQPLDLRTFTVDWSKGVSINTHKITGSIMIVR